MLWSHFFSEGHVASCEKLLEDELGENEQEFEVLISLINLLMSHTCHILVRCMKVTVVDMEPMCRVKACTRSNINKTMKKIMFALKKFSKH